MDARSLPPKLYQKTSSVPPPLAAVELEISLKEGEGWGDVASIR